MSQFPTPTRSQAEPQPTSPPVVAQVQTSQSAGGSNDEQAPMTEAEIQELRQRLQSGQLTERGGPSGVPEAQVTVRRRPRRSRWQPGRRPHREHRREFPYSRDRPCLRLCKRRSGHHHQDHVSPRPNCTGRRRPGHGRQRPPGRQNASQRHNHHSRRSDRVPGRRTGKTWRRPGRSWVQSGRPRRRPGRTRRQPGAPGGRGGLFGTVTGVTTPASPSRPSRVHSPISIDDDSVILETREVPSPTSKSECRSE